MFSLDFNENLAALRMCQFMKKKSMGAGKARGGGSHREWKRLLVARAFKKHPFLFTFDTTLGMSGDD